MFDGYRDCFSVGGYLNLRDNCVGQYEANCYLNHESSDYDSVMGLREIKLATPSYFTEYMPYLFSESIGGDIQDYATENCNNIPAKSRPSVAALDSPKKLLDTIPFPMFADGLACDFGTSIFQNIPDDFQSIVAEGGITADLMSEVNSESPFTGNSGILGQESSPPGPSAEQENLKMLEEGIKPTASRTQRQHIGKVEQIDEPWRDRNHVDEVVYGIGKLEVRLQCWNKQQLDAVQETSYTTRGSASRKRGRP